MADVGDPIILERQIVKGCETGDHDLISDTAEFKLIGSKMIVTMKCGNCGQSVEREEAAGALLPDFQPEAPPGQEAPVGPAPQPQPVEKIVVIGGSPADAAKESDDFWKQFE